MPARGGSSMHTMPMSNFNSTVMMIMIIFVQMFRRSIFVDLFSQPQKSYLTQAVWLDQSDCNENQTDVTTPDNKLSNLTMAKNGQESFNWNVKTLRLKSVQPNCAEMTPAPRSVGWVKKPQIGPDATFGNIWLSLPPSLSKYPCTKACPFYIWLWSHFWACRHVTEKPSYNNIVKWVSRVDKH